jgi:hypothetical protein
MTIIKMAFVAGLGLYIHAMPYVQAVANIPRLDLKHGPTVNLIFMLKWQQHVANHKKKTEPHTTKEHHKPSLF